tara:strand:+ start:1357 stop:2481 length:1125 start_codon:yes stop_codon:yes gene_type:complete
MTDIVEIILKKNNVTTEFMKLTMEEKMKVLELGLNSFRSVNDKMLSWNNKEWEDTMKSLKKEIKELKKEKKEKIQEKEKEMIIFMKKTEEENENMRIKIKKQTELRYKNELELKEEKIVNLEEKLDTKREEMSGIAQKIYNEFEEKMEKKEKRNEEKMNKIVERYEDKLKKEMDKREKGLVHLNNSTIKGQDGELFIFGELNRRFPKAEIEDTHKQANRGDFILKEGALNMLIEIKNYKKNVIKPEITKFYKDIHINKDVNCGILISLKSGICAKNDFQFEIRDGKPILFLHKVMENMKHIEFARSFFNLILNAGLDLTNKEVCDKIKNDVPSIKKNWNKIRQKIKKFQVDITGLIETQEGLMCNFFNLLKIKY